MEELRNNNRMLSVQVFVLSLFDVFTIYMWLTDGCRKSLENSLAQLNGEHVEVLVRISSRSPVI